MKDPGPIVRPLGVICHRVKAVILPKDLSEEAKKGRREAEVGLLLWLSAMLSCHLASCLHIPVRWALSGLFLLASLLPAAKDVHKPSQNVPLWFGTRLIPSHIRLPDP